MPVMSAVRLPATLDACFGLTVKAAWVMVAWSALDYAMERRGVEQEAADEQAGDARRDEGDDGQSAGEGAHPADSECDAAAQGEGGYVARERGDHQPDALCGGAGVQLRVDAGADGAGQGTNLHAQRIREEARWAGVPIVENPPLARSLYKSVEEGQSIPYELYAAVAGILAFLYRQQVEKAARERKAAEEARGGTRCRLPHAPSEVRA